MGGGFRREVGRRTGGRSVRRRRTMEEIIGDLRAESVEKKTRFLENGGWQSLHRWLSRWYTSKRRRSLIHSILQLLKELPVASTSKMLENFDSPILELVEKIVNESVKSDFSAWGSRTQKLYTKLLEHWLTIYNDKLKYQERAKQTPEEIAFDTDIEITTVFEDEKEVTLQPDGDKIWWKVTTEGRTEVVRMEEEYWMRLGEEESGSKMVVSARKKPRKLPSPRKKRRIVAKPKKRQRKAGPLGVSSSPKENEVETRAGVSSAVTSQSKPSDGNVAERAPPHPQKPPKKKKENLSLEETVLVVKQREKEKKEQERRVKRLEEEEDIVGVALRKKIRLDEILANVPKEAEGMDTERPCSSGQTRDTADMRNEVNRVKFKAMEAALRNERPVAWIPPIRPTILTQKTLPSIKTVVYPSGPNVTPPYRSKSITGSATAPTKHLESSNLSPQNTLPSSSNPLDPRLANGRRNLTPNTDIPAVVNASKRDSSTMTSPSSSPATAEFPMKESQPVSQRPWATSTSTSWNSGQVYARPASHFRNTVASRSTSPSPPQTLPLTAANYCPPPSIAVNRPPTSSLVGTPQQQFISPMDPRRAGQRWVPPIAPFQTASIPKPLTTHQSVTSLPQRRQTLESQVSLPQGALAPASFQSASQLPVQFPVIPTSMSSLQAPVTLGFYRERSEGEATPTIAATASSPQRPSSPKETKPSIRDLPPLPPEPPLSRRSLVPYNDDDDDVVPLEDDEPLPWIIHKIHFTEPLCPRRPKRLSDSLKVFDWCGIKWPEPIPGDQHHPVLHIDNRRFIRKKKAKPAILVDLTASPEGKKREDERKKVTEEERRRREEEMRRRRRNDEKRRRQEEEERRRRRREDERRRRHREDERRRRQREDERRRRHREDERRRPREDGKRRQSEYYRTERRDHEKKGRREDENMQKRKLTPKTTGFENVRRPVPLAQPQMTFNYILDTQFSPCPSPPVRSPSDSMNVPYAAVARDTMVVSSFITPAEKPVAPTVEALRSLLKGSSTTPTEEVELSQNLQGVPRMSMHPNYASHSKSVTPDYAHSVLSSRVSITPNFPPLPRETRPINPPPPPPLPESRPLHVASPLTPEKLIPKVSSATESSRNVPQLPHSSKTSSGTDRTMPQSPPSTLNPSTNRKYPKLSTRLRVCPPRDDYSPEEEMSPPPRQPYNSDPGMLSPYQYEDQELTTRMNRQQNSPGSYNNRNYDHPSPQYPFPPYVPDCNLKRF